eukprot:CAMPEP_0170510952 /NCGR_PEP_ID=MMETSP0208-20121228/66039_1 /TAXON_ID=197538 /ORGANISM="Strombidium inclinatum, Strain S3" /LENGTH=35 /DNA_ID= /DNA_START= /DNA_END= /DNA_ORIENTATION=
MTNDDGNYFGETKEVSIESESKDDFELEDAPNDDY